MPNPLLGLLGNLVNRGNNGRSGTSGNNSAGLFQPGDGRTGLWQNVAGAARDTVIGSPIGQLVTQGPRAGFNATPVGAALEQAGLFQPGDGRTGLSQNVQGFIDGLFGPRGPTAPGAYGPQADGYAGVPGTPPAGDPQFGGDATTDWAAASQGGRPGKASSGPGAAAGRPGANSSQGLGTGAYGNGNASGASMLGFMNQAGSLWKQSGDSGLGNLPPVVN